MQSMRQGYTRLGGSIAVAVLAGVSFGQVIEIVPATRPAVLTPATLPAATLPTTQPLKPAPLTIDRLQPYTELSRLCKAYENQTRVDQWREVWRQTFDRKNQAKWLKPPAPEQDDKPLAQPAGTLPVMTAEKIAGRDSVVLDASGMERGYFLIGEPMSDNFAVEFVGSSLSERPCDLSIMCNADGGVAPGFQFGANRNTRNILWTVSPETGVMVGNVLPVDQLIVPNRWFTVRMEVRDGQATAFLDGKPLGTFPTKPEIGRLYQPAIYIYQSKIAVDEARIEVKIPSERVIDADQVFASVFGQRTRAEVSQQITELVDLLGDGESAVREGATQLLRGMGTLTIPALQDAISNGVPEQSIRADQLLRAVYKRSTTQPAVQSSKPKK